MQVQMGFSFLKVCYFVVISFISMDYPKLVLKSGPSSYLEPLDKVT
jgi:hypothetical protein